MKVVVTNNNAYDQYKNNDNDHNNNHQVPLHMTASVHNKTFKMLLNKNESLMTS